MVRSNKTRSRDVVFEEQSKWKSTDQGVDGIPKTVLHSTIQEASDEDDEPSYSTFEVGECSQNNEVSNEQSDRVNSAGNPIVSGVLLE
ncbi:hypothetical protein E3N88_05262 [Mikania micrantha]|uniref:Uncharacterized protein n=1 Tax=Mikania micrantha TaxID=192012 RepID=A0A5N6PL44_9ASTR|nr:hypothetical protein E3N88_05262 [Mikania micrantha]